MQKENLQKINDYLWEFKKSGKMTVPARIYISSGMLNEVLKDRSTEQLINTSTLPGILGFAMAMPDIHEGYGFPIGGVAAMDLEQGVISPGGVGYDINCGMRLLKSELSEKEILPYLDQLATEIQKEVPSGLGKGRQIKLSIESLDKILKGGAKRLIEQGYGEKDDFENCESNGFIEEADPAVVSEHAKNRGRDQVGTLGSGNHFLEIQKVEQVFDQETARRLGLFPGQIVIMIHTGSRGLGHQIATDYIQLMMRKMGRYNILLPDRELACVPFRSSEGQNYFRAMSAGANYAWANRQMITYFVRKAWKKIFGENIFLKTVYDVAHNIAKIEKHQVNGKEKLLLVHRKGATRAFPAQPVLIPGSMGTASYVLVGTEQGKDSWYSTCHGAGRTMSRHAATRTLSGQEIINQLKAKGILVKCYSMRGIAEEAPQVYKNIDAVVEVVHQAGLSKKVARLTPLAVIKGE